LDTTLTAWRKADTPRLLGFDRMLGYGLKYASGFNDTPYLGRIGLKSAGV
jgi:hypothetical protein